MPVIINGSTGISGTDGSAAAPAVQGTDTNTGMFFPAADQIAFSEGGVEVMRLDASGNVGIGTSSPDRRLKIGGAGASFGIDAGSGQLAIDPVSGGVAQIDVGGANALRFNTNSAERMRIDASGRVSIGSAAVNALLTVDGNGPLLTNLAFAFYAQSGNAPVTGYAAGQNLTNISIWASGRINAEEFNARSDARLKKDVTPIPASDAWHFVQNVTPVHYKWINSPDDGHKFGFIAQDVVKAGFPNLVGQYPDSNVQEVTDADGFTSPAGVMLSVNYDQIVPVLASALRDALAQIEELKARVAALEAR